VRGPIALRVMRVIEEGLMRRASTTVCFLASFMLLGALLSWAPRAIANVGSGADIADTGPQPCPPKPPKPAPSPSPSPNPKPAPKK
jgi:hypothetical protein